MAKSAAAAASVHRPLARLDAALDWALVTWHVVPGLFRLVAPARAAGVVEGPAEIVLPGRSSGRPEGVDPPVVSE